MADVKFIPDSNGIRQIFKSSEMQAVLKDAAQSFADEANARASSHAADLGIKEFRVPPYSSHVDVLTNTAVGQAHTNGKMGHRDFAKFNTLASVNH